MNFKFRKLFKLVATRVAWNIRRTLQKRRMGNSACDWKANSRADGQKVKWKCWKSTCPWHKFLPADCHHCTLLPASTTVYFQQVIGAIRLEKGTTRLNWYSRNWDVIRSNGFFQFRLFCALVYNGKKLTDYLSPCVSGGFIQIHELLKAKITTAVPQLRRSENWFGTGYLRNLFTFTV